MKNFIKVFGLIAIAAVIVFAGCGGGAGGPVAVTGVSLDQNTLNVAVEGTVPLAATVAPANASNQAVTWSSDDEGVATVSNGTVSGVSVGEATITVTTADGGKTANCVVAVYDSSDPGALINLKDFGTTEGIICFNVSTGDEWDDAWDAISEPGNYVINITDNLTGYPSINLNDSLKPADDIIISLRGAATITTDNDVWIDTGETVILRGVTLAFTDNDRFVSCNAGSKLIMEEGSAITGGYCGVKVDNNGVFTMNGGKISGNNNGGVEVNAGTFTMNGGEIRGNGHAGNNTSIGGVLVGGSSFIMNGGEIYGNYGEFGGGVTIYGENASFEKKSGAWIFNNTSKLGTGHQVLVGGYDEDWNPAAILAYRDDQVTAGETLKITLNADGDDIASETGTWRKPSDTPTYSIELSETGTYTFPSATVGYGQQPTKTITITNTGNQPTGELILRAVGGNFVPSPSQIGSQPVGGVTTFTVRPSSNLSVGTYTATITVSSSSSSSANGITASFDVKFTVNAEEP